MTRALTAIFWTAVSFLAVWLLGNLAFFHTLAVWDVSPTYQRSLLFNILCGYAAVLSALSARGPVKDQLQQVFVSTAVVFGLYALAIVVGRLFFSRVILTSAAPLTLAVGVAAVLIRQRRARLRVGVIAPLVKETPDTLANAEVIEDPEHDFRGLDIILVDLHEQVSGRWAQALSRAMLCGARIRHIYEHLEDQSGAVSLDHFEIEHVAFNGSGPYLHLKRALDLTASILILPLALPLIGLAALAILATSGGPIFFVQNRMGQGGKVFRMWKLRTMRPAAPSDGDREAVPGDARVTGVGRILRRTRIDELPQLWNILKGDMSLIGPRPEAETFHNAYTEIHPKFAYRCLVRPGVSGWAQINAPPSSNADEAAFKLAYDLYYIKHRSIGLDLLIALRTLWTVTHGSGVR